MAERLVSAPDTLHPRAVQGSVLFADIAGFTRFAEGRPPDQVIRAMNEVFDIATNAIARAGGVTAGFAGDAVIAAFTFADDGEMAAKGALLAAAEIDAAMGARRFDGVQLHLRIGIASGQIAAGSVGGERRRAYTVYGDPVNLAQRLQELGKTFGDRLVICETSWGLAQSEAGFADRGQHVIRGRNGAVRVFGATAAVREGGPGPAGAA